MRRSRSRLLRAPNAPTRPVQYGVRERPRARALQRRARRHGPRREELLLRQPARHSRQVPVAQHMVLRRVLPGQCTSNLIHKPHWDLQNYSCIVCAD